MSNSKGRIFIVSGPSGAGKTSLRERLLAEDGGIRFSVSYTTRQKRGLEVDGQDYHFVDRKIFEEMIARNRFLEWEEVHGHLYGTPKKNVLETLREGFDVLLDVDVKGALNVRSQCSEACLIFIEPPSRDELVQRLSLRGEREIGLRMQRVDQEMKQKYLFQYVVINDRIDTAFCELKGIVEMVRRQSLGKNNR
jgi:guanylate kinase